VEKNKTEIGRKVKRSKEGAHQIGDPGKREVQNKERGPGSIRRGGEGVENTVEIILSQKKKTRGGKGGEDLLAPLLISELRR